MGMSHDLEIAIEEGATEMRIGTALFGEREEVVIQPAHRRRKTEPSASPFACSRAPAATKSSGEYQDGLKIRLTAPPVDDRANEALRNLLASRLKVPLAAVRIASGERSRTKRVEIRGVTAAMIRGLAGE